MWLRKKNKSYISILIDDARISWFFFEKNHQSYLLKAYQEENSEELGIFEKRIFNSILFAEWIYNLFELHKIQRPNFAIKCSVDCPEAFQYQLFFYQLDFSLNFIGSVKRDNDLMDLVDNELSIPIKKTDLCDAISLWGDVNENGS